MKYESILWFRNFWNNFNLFSKQSSPTQTQMDDVYITFITFSLRIEMQKVFKSLSVSFWYQCKIPVQLNSAPFVAEYKTTVN